MRQNRGLYIARRAGHAPSPAQHSASGVKATCPGLERALAAVRGDLGPLSADEQAERRTLIAREYARAEARRAPAPQLSFPEAA